MSVPDYNEECPHPDFRVDPDGATDPVMELELADSETSKKLASSSSPEVQPQDHDASSEAQPQGHDAAPYDEVPDPLLAGFKPRGKAQKPVAGRPRPK